MRVSTIQQYNQSLNAILKLQAGTSKFQEQISSGKRVNTPSDDPVAAAQILAIEERINAAGQYSRNADLVELRLTQQEGVITNANDALQRIRELAIRGKTTSLSLDDRRFIAQEVRERANELLDVANSRNSAGEYIFAGSKVDTQAFSKSLTGTVAYNGDNTTRDINISEFRTVTEGFSGAEVFMAIRNGNGSYVTDANAANTGTAQIVPGGVSNLGSFLAHDFRIVFTSAATFDVIDDTAGATVLSAQPYVEDAAISFNGIELSIQGTPATGDEFGVQASRNQSVFETVDRLIKTLESEATNPTLEVQFQADMDRALGDIDQAMDSFRESQAVIGARRNTLESQKFATEELTLQLQTVRSQLEDADLVGAISGLAQQSNALEAAQSAFVRVQSLSLFNFLR